MAQANWLPLRLQIRVGIRQVLLYGVVECSNFDCNRVVAVWLIAAGMSCAGAVAAGLQAASNNVVTVMIAASLVIMRTIQEGAGILAQWVWR